MAAPTPCAQLTGYAGPSKRRSHDVTRGTLKSHRTGEGPKILLFPHCSQKSSFTRYGDAPSYMIVFGSAEFSWIPRAFFLFPVWLGGFQVVWGLGKYLLTSLCLLLFNNGVWSLSWLKLVETLLASSCFPYVLKSLEDCLGLADFQVPFCFLQQGISYCILSGASPYKVEAVDFAIKTPETQCIFSNCVIVWFWCS